MSKLNFIRLKFIRSYLNHHRGTCSFPTKILWWSAQNCVNPRVYIQSLSSLAIPFLTCRKGWFKARKFTKMEPQLFQSVHGFRCFSILIGLHCQCRPLHFQRFLLEDLHRLCAAKRSGKWPINDIDKTGTKTWRSARHCSGQQHAWTWTQSPR